MYPIAEALAPVKASEWNFIYGILTVIAEMANASTAFMWVEWYGDDKNMMLDAFSAIPVVRTCSDADFNRGLENWDLKIVVRDMGVVSDFTKGEWNTVSGVFVATDEIVLVDSMFAA